jgi:YggT family protein
LVVLLSILIGGLAAIRIALIGRILIDWIRLIFRNFKPTGVGLALLTVPYIMTDWAIKPLRKVIKPIPVGASSFDLSVIVLWLLVGFIQYLLGLVPLPSNLG